MVDYGAGGVAFNFTFQSGYIPTADAVSSTNSSASLHSDLVIFQLVTDIPAQLLLSLYIPIWLYSNEYVKKVSEQDENFTFQSGYIPILPL